MGQAHVSCYEHTKKSNHGDFSPVGLMLTLQIILKMCLTGRSGRASNQVIRKLKEKISEGKLPQSGWKEHIASNFVLWIFLCKS